MDSGMKILCINWACDDWILRGRMTRKEGPSLFTIVSAIFFWRFVRLDLKSCFEVHLAMYEVGCYWQRSKH
jgi:hypothetical protein